MAVLVATKMFGWALAIFIIAVLPQFIFAGFEHSAYRLQLFTANRLTPFFYPRGMFRFVEFFCGRKCAAWGLNNYAAKLFIDEQYAPAVKAFTRAIELDNKSALYWAHRGASKYSLGHHNDAIQDLSTALDLDSSHQIALIYRGYTFMAMEDYPMALADLTKVECTSSNHYVVAYYRADLHERLQQWKQAFDNFLLAFQLDPSQTDAGIALARLQAACPDDSLRDGDKAIENANNMCARTNWNDWAAISVLGSAYAEAGDFDSAIKYAVMALEMAPEDEKPERSRRITQFQNRQPFRIPLTESATVTAQRVK